MQFSVTSADVPQIVDRFTAPEEPGYTHGDAQIAHAYYTLGYGEQYRDANQNPLTYSVVWACVRWISQTIASLGWHVYEKTGRERVQIPLDDDVAWCLDMQANPEMSSFDFRQVMLADALLWGNGYAEMEWDGMRRLRWLWRLDPGRVSPDRTAAGRLVYEVENGSGVKNSLLYPDEMMHVKGLGPDGLVGYSVVEMARRTISLGLQQEKFGEKFFGRGPMPGGILKVPGNPSKEAMITQRESFERLYGGAKNAGRVIVLTGGNEFSPMTLPNTDAQFLESRRFGVEEICRWYGVPPHKVADLQRSTFSNIEQQAIEAVQDCLLPWCRRLESESDIKMFGRAGRGKRYTRLNLATLLRGDNMTQTNTITQKVNGGIMTPNEGREYLDMNPMEGGDELLVQGAMVTLDSRVNPPELVGPNEPKIVESDTGNAEEAGAGAGTQEEAAATGDVQASALNGAQIAGLLEIANRLVTDQLPPKGTRALIEAAFPLMDKKLMDTIVEELDKFVPAAPAPIEPTEEPDDEPPADVAAVFVPLLRNEYARLLRVEADKARRADNRGELRTWAQGYYRSDSVDRVAEAIGPACGALLAAFGRSTGGAAELAKALAESHVADSIGPIHRDGIAAIADWETLPGRAERQAANHLGFAWKFKQGATE